MLNPSNTCGEIIGWIILFHFSSEYHISTIINLILLISYWLNSCEILSVVNRYHSVYFVLEIFLIHCSFICYLLLSLNAGFYKFNYIGKHLIEVRSALYPLIHYAYISSILNSGKHIKLYDRTFSLLYYEISFLVYLLILIIQT